MKTPVLIVGGGLAGLTAAYHFHQAGIRFILLEARDRLGGRILSTNAKGIPSADGFDLGPSWFWPGMQTALNYVVDVLELPYFAQHGDGDMLFQRHSGGVPQRFAGVRQVPESMRLTGGVGSIITALSSKLPEDNIRLGVRVTKAILTDSEVEVCVEDSNGATSSLTAMHVVFALPPRLLEATIAFSPALDIDTTRNWRDTPTWMAPHAKLFALYERPFWRQAGLSGTAQSLVGPLGEIHDATTASGESGLVWFYRHVQQTTFGNWARCDHRSVDQAARAVVRTRSGSPSRHFIQGLGSRPSHCHTWRSDLWRASSPRRSCARPNRMEKSSVARGQ